MKNIGLLTFYETDNYGTCLQAWALSKTIELLGYNCSILNFNPIHNTCKTNIKSKSKLKTACELGIKGCYHYFLTRNSRLLSVEAFDSFRKEMPITKNMYQNIDDLKNAREEYDAFVCGSDMVWSWESEQFLDAYFLKFAPKGKRISYAPSFGNTCITPEMANYYMESLKEIDYLSCREVSGVELIKSLTNRECINVLDPTMLLTNNNWQSLLCVDKSNHKENIILCYLFGGLEKLTRNNLENVILSNEIIRNIPISISDFCLEKKYCNKGYGPREFVESYLNAKMIITNSFHGLVFALIFQKPFILLHRNKGDHWAHHEERMLSLLKQLDLDERIIYPSDVITRDMFSLDYSKITPMIDKKREYSILYLKKALQKAAYEGVREY